MKVNDFIITCKQCGSSDVRIFSGSVQYEILTKIICDNEKCNHVEVIK